MHEQHLARENKVALARYGREIENVQTAAQKAFASLNGWIIGKSTAGAEQLIPPEKRQFFVLPPARYPRGWQHYVGRVSDHDFMCREAVRPYQVAAVVCQPYQSRVLMTEALAAAERSGLALHVPADPTASIWNPGSTLFLVFTRPEVTVEWLPEQKTGLAIQRAYADENAQ
jgi:hypothetical protein